jgi:hypothetical protein
MSRITVTIRFKNNTDLSLSKQGEQIIHGSWATGAAAPDHIAAGQTVVFQTEGNSVLGGPPVTGTEGWVRYWLVGEPPQSELYLHWDSPLVESQYGNTYHEQCPPGFELFHLGGQGHDAVCDVTFQRAEPHFTSFRPSVHGLRFANRWSPSLNAMTVGYLCRRLQDGLPEPFKTLTLPMLLLSDDTFPFTTASAGLCGGMVFTALDYFYANRAVPPTTDAPSNANDPLFMHIRDRLVDSFDISGGGTRYLMYQLPIYPDGDANVATVTGMWRGRAWVTYRDTVAKVRADILAGNPSPLGLIRAISMNPADLGEHHQVLAWGYFQDASRISFYIYDPNEKSNNDKVTLSFYTNDTTQAVKVWRSTDGVTLNESSIRCILTTESYQMKSPP